MKLASRRIPTLLSALSLLTSACGAQVPPGGQVIPAPRPGALATLEGHFELTSDARGSGPVRLALAWYPEMLGEEAESLTRPRSIVTEDLAYPGDVPIAYRFGVYSPPPEQAQAPLGEGLRGNGSLGILLAYRDGNGNGRLDSIPENGQPVDQVVGSSLDWSASKAYAVLYVGVAQEASTGLQPGFNLIEVSGPATSALVPLSTPIPLPLSGASHLNAFVCESLWSNHRPERPCGLDPSPEEPEETTLHVAGTVTLAGGKAEVDLTISQEGDLVRDAQVTLDGQPVAYSPSRYVYAATLGAASLEGKASVELRVVARGEESRRTLPLPGGFDLLEPTPSGRISSGTGTAVRWTPSANAQAYKVSLEAHDSTPVVSTLTTGTEHTFEPVAHTGTVTLRAEALAWPADNDRHGFVELKRVREQPLTLGTCEAPAHSTLQVAGALEVYDEAAMLNVRVTEAGQSLENAEVLLDGRAVSYRREVGAYRMHLVGPWGSPANGQLDLRIRAGGKELCRTLSIPGDFGLGFSGPVYRTLPFTVRWTQSAGAQVYTVSVTRGDGGVLARVSTNAFEHTFEPVDHAGVAILRAEAVGHAPGNAELGWLDVKRVRLLSLPFTP